jgi:hypothetical protein
VDTDCGAQGKDVAGEVDCARDDDVPPVRHGSEEPGDGDVPVREAEIQIGDACVVCWRSPADRAHLIDRSLVPDHHWDPARTVRLCREHHEKYDDHDLDLLPYLEPHHRAELARAVQVFGLLGTLERVTGMAWRAHPLAPTTTPALHAGGVVSDA